MKAYISKNKPLQKAAPLHSCELSLTIGMIVKNEEKTLERCLSSLKPLMDAVPSELIVTDTGSTDRTVEIAQKYTDRILHFEWCDDFSAARNTGLSIARGEWFLYLDGDEWFEDVTPLIDFLKSRESGNYGAAMFPLRDYKNVENDVYDVDYICRLHRTYPGIAFQNKIHEEMKTAVPIKNLTAYINHDGYAYRNKEEEEKKNNRNIVMLKADLKENPNDEKALFQLSEQYIGNDNEAAVQYAKRGMELTLKGPNAHSYTRMADALLKAYCSAGDDEALLRLLPEALQREEEPGLFHLEFYGLCQIAAYRRKEYEKAVELGRRYLEWYRDFEDGKMDQTLRMYTAFRFLDLKAREMTVVRTGLSLLKLGRTEEARDCLNRLDLSLPEAVKNGSLDLCFDLACKTDDWTAAVEFYRGLLTQPEKAQAFMEYADACCRDYPSRQDKILCAFAGAEGSGGYFLLCRLRLAERGGDRKQVTSLLNLLMDQEKEWNVRYSDAVYCALREKINLAQILTCVDMDDIPSIVSKMQKEHGDFLQTVAEYFDMYSFENAKALYCSACLLEQAVLRRDAADQPNRYRNLIQAYMENSAKYVRVVYRPEMFTAAGLPALPRVYRFGYYAGAALDALREGDGVRYLAGLRNALKEYPAMEKPIEFLLNRFENEQERRDARAEEFSELAGQVKKTIETLIAQGNLQQAGIYTLQLAKLLPDDDDVRRYQKLTHTEPTMPEIVSHLPQ